MIRKTCKNVAAVALVAASVLGAGTASAHIKAASSNTTAQTYSDGAWHDIRINGAATSLTFETGKDNKRIAVLFNAESSVRANDHYSWLEVDIFVDGVRIAPTTGDNAFDTSNGNGLLGNWESHAINGYYVVPHKGVHTVTVKGRLVGYSAGEQWRIDDISVLVIR